MRDYGRRLVIDSTFDRAVDLTLEAFQREGLHIIGYVDLQDYARRKLRHDLRQYVLLQVLPAHLTIDATMPGKWREQFPAYHDFHRWG